MRLPSFRLPKPHVSAVYLSSEPLFDFDLALQPLADGLYQSIVDGVAIRFERRDLSYRISGDATPETVTLIPVDARPGAYIFQQSAGRGITFYGALERTGADGFLLFSPECLRDEAIRRAKASGATLIEAGCLFTRSGALLDSLLPLLATAPSHCWSRYQRA